MQQQQEADNNLKQSYTSAYANTHHSILNEDNISVHSVYTKQ